MAWNLSDLPTVDWGEGVDVGKMARGVFWKIIAFVPDTTGELRPQMVPDGPVLVEFTAGPSANWATEWAPWLLT